jgi:hypothetical protein
MIEALTVVSVVCLMFTMFNLGRAYEVMQECKRICAEGMQK